MRRRRLLAVLLLCLCLVALGACRSSKGPSGLQRITERGELLVGVTGEQPPLNMTARNGELIGLEIALARVLAQSMGVEARFVRMPFKELLDAVEDGDVDMVMSGVTITPERSARVTFVGPYYTSGKSFCTRRPELAAAEIPEDLDAQRPRIAVLKGSTSEAFAVANLPNSERVPTAQIEEAILKLKNDEVDALVADRETCSFAVLRWPDAVLLASETVFTVEPMGIAVSQKEPHLANLIQTYLNAIAERGVLEKVQAFWFKDSSWVKDLR